MRPSYKPMAYIASLLVLAAFLGTAYGNSQEVIVQAGLSVNCPFSVSLTPTQSIFSQFGFVTIDYSIKDLVQCPAGSLSGNLVITNLTTTVLYYTANVVFNGITATPTNGVFSINALIFPPSDDKATLTLNSLSYTNSTSAQFAS